MADVDGILEEVAASVGLDDYGDPSFREGLEQLHDSITEEAGLNAIGNSLIGAQALEAIASRTGWSVFSPAFGAVS